MSRLLPPLVATIVALLVGGARYGYETRVLMPLAPDPQNAIWHVLSLVTSVVAATVSFALCWAGLRLVVAAAAAGRPVPASGLALLVGLAVVVVWTARDLHRMSVVRRALIDAADPATPAERLRELALHPGGPGYEIDNRVARHPNTRPDVLRMLHGRPDQVGTEMCLAANPNTPDDILRELAGRGDEWGDLIREHLRSNPRHAELFGTEASSGGARDTGAK
jgi:hypothetical protein